MPTEVTPAPFRSAQQFPVALERQVNYGSVPTLIATLQPQRGDGGMLALGWSSVPPTGPARIAEIMPNKVLPNGMRNPYAPYAGEVYRPSAEKGEIMTMGGALASAPATQSLPYAPRSLSAHPVGATIRPVHVALGGRRMDDGWDGSSGRAHAGYMPDPTSTAGRLGRTVPQYNADWRYAPSSYQNHARMTPSAMYDTPPSGYLAPPVQAHSYQPRRASVNVPIRSECPTCSDLGSDSRQGHQSIRHASFAGSPLRQVEKLPSVYRGRENQVTRKNRSTSRRSREAGRRRACSECSACC